MEPITQPAPKKRGRPSKFQTINGQLLVTQEQLEKEISMLERHRTACRDRYRLKRDMLKRLRPDLFCNLNGHRRANQQALLRYGIPISPDFLQQTEEETDTSNPENGTGFREITLREIYSGSTPQIQGQSSGI